MDKSGLRQAAEKIEKAIEAYGAGDLTTSARELEEALKLMPQHARAKLMLGWVRDLASGKRRLDGLDDETLAAIDLGLDEPMRGGGDDELTREKRAADAPVMNELDLGESPWDPVPLTPGGSKGLAPKEQPAAPPPQLEDPPRPRRITGPVSSAPPPASASPSPPSSPSSEPQRRTPSATLLGVSAPNTPMLTPASPRALYDTSENTGSMTREWRSSASSTTNPNLPPLDVPELTDEQIQELLALDGSPIALDVDPPKAEPRLAVHTDLGLGPEPEGRLLEIEAEPEGDSRPNFLTGATTMVRDQVPPRRRDATTPDADLHSNDRLAPYDAPGFDSLELTPTRDRRELARAVATAPSPSHSADDDLRLPPLDPPRRDEILEEGTNPTNPFIKRKLAEYSYPTGQLPRVDDLPPAPGILGDTSKTRALDGLPAIQEPLDKGDLEQALFAAENLVASAGGVDGEDVRPHVWLLERVYESVLGSLGAVPRHGQAVSDLDPRSAFLLSRLDGMSSVEDLLDISGMPRLEALRCLALLYKRRVITLG